jgi:hypothetical protein
LGRCWSWPGRCSGGGRPSLADGDPTLPEIPLGSRRDLQSRPNSRRARRRPPTGCARCFCASASLEGAFQSPWRPVGVRITAAARSRGTGTRSRFSYALRRRRTQTTARSRTATRSRPRTRRSRMAATGPPARRAAGAARRSDVPPARRDADARADLHPVRWLLLVQHSSHEARRGAKRTIRNRALGPGLRRAN